MRTGQDECCVSASHGIDASNESAETHLFKGKSINRKKRRNLAVDRE